MSLSLSISQRFLQLAGLCSKIVLRTRKHATLTNTRYSTAHIAAIRPPGAHTHIRHSFGESSLFCLVFHKRRKSQKASKKVGIVAGVDCRIVRNPGGVNNRRYPLIYYPIWMYFDGCPL